MNVIIGLLRIYLETIESDPDWMIDADAKVGSSDHQPGYRRCWFEFTISIAFFVVVYLCLCIQVDFLNLLASCIKYGWSWNHEFNYMQMGRRKILKILKFRGFRQLNIWSATSSHNKLVLSIKTILMLILSLISKISWKIVLEKMIIFYINL